MLSKGMQISNTYQMSVNDLVITANGARLVNEGYPPLIGDFYTRNWTTNLTYFTEMYDDYFIDEVVPITSGSEKGGYRLPGYGIVFNLPNETYFQ